MDLHTPISQLSKVGKVTAKKLENIGLKNCLDLLYHYPFRYEDWSKIISIKELKSRGFGTIKAKIKSINSRKTPRKRIIITEAIAVDKTDSIKIIWFGQSFLNNILKSGQDVYLAGKVENSLTYGLQLVSPSYEFPKKEAPIHLGRLVPIYPITENVSQKQIRLLIKQILPLTEKIQDWLPDEIKGPYQLMNLSVALGQIHFPASQNLFSRAEHRLKFDELFLIQLQTKILREKLKARHAPKLEIKLEKIKKFVKDLPFELTPSQKKSAWEIIKDLERGKPMNRLLEGDVGSGKTVVATMAILNTVLNNYQVAYLAPTEILANQHFNNISVLLKKWPVKIGLLTRETQLLRNNKKITPAQGWSASGGKVRKKEILGKIENGELDLIIGTHAIIQENVKFNNLGLIIVDEQHRFGVEQRARLSAQINADQDADKRGLLYGDLTYKIRGLLFNVYNKLGPSYKENVYGNALEEELKKNNLPYKREGTIDIVYDNKKIGVYKPDFIIDNKIILEIKSQPFMGKLEVKQTWYYLKGSDHRLALLVNFGAKELQIKRFIYDTIRDNPRLPAQAGSNQRKSASGISENQRIDQRKSAHEMAHFLSMTATPIPRSLALTLYGDLDLSIIDEMPPGRKEVEIKIVGAKEKNKVYNFIREEIKNGQQAFVICPLIESRTNADSTQTNADPDADKRGHQTQINADTDRGLTRIKTCLRRQAQINADDIGANPRLDRRKSALMDVKAVRQEYEKLSSGVFADLKLAALHGKLKAKEKDKIMADFLANKINILISTTVIEVGIDVPNATMMLIEGAERFGLAQLWQLKGRIGRSDLQSYCFLFPENPSEKARERLKAMLNAKNGFELAEKDLEIRGPGELFGFKQSGYLESLKLARLSDTMIIKEAQAAAQKIFSSDSSLKKYSQLQKKVEELTKITHLE